MAAPTSPCDVKILLANSEPSTHGTSATCGDYEFKSAYEARAVMRPTLLKGRVCEGFRMPAADERCSRHRRPASENLQGRKPREGNVRSCGVLYGDLSAAGSPGSHSEADVLLSSEWSGPAKTGPDHATLLHALKTEGLFRPA